jgi:SPP1 family predicted phage head-tail adaptor
MKVSEFNQLVTFRAYSESQNDSGGIVKAISETKEVWAKVEVSDGSTSASQSQMMSDSNRTVTIRYDAAINTNWVMIYEFQVYQINNVSILDPNYKRYMRLNVSTSLAVGTYAGPAGGIDNWTDFSWTNETGRFYFTGADEVPNTLTVLEFYNPADHSQYYINGEGHSFSIGAFEGREVFAEYLTVGYVFIRWRRVSAAPDYTPLTDWDSTTLQVSNLSARWYRIWWLNNGSVYDIYPGFTNYELYSIYGNYIGAVNNIDELVSTWNNSPDNALFLITDYKAEPFYFARITPDPAQLIYPFQFVKVAQ